MSGSDLSTALYFLCIQTSQYDILEHGYILFVCVEVLQPSQPNGVMLSAVSLPNQSSKRLTSIVHILCQKLTTALLETAKGRE